eukprot:snap_masked-scaffold_15-processed-gene-10.27-mRNA-1 protein AED:1.00 eAED:1.00 QI:0/0/0/0/1/1/2/0/110
MFKERASSQDQGEDIMNKIMCKKRLRENKDCATQRVIIYCFQRCFRYFSLLDVDQLHGIGYKKISFYSSGWGVGLKLCIYSKKSSSIKKSKRKSSRKRNLQELKPHSSVR